MYLIPCFFNKRAPFICAFFIMLFLCIIMFIVYCYCIMGYFVDSFVDSFISFLATCLPRWYATMIAELAMSASNMLSLPLMLDVLIS